MANSSLNKIVLYIFVAVAATEQQALDCNAFGTDQDLDVSAYSLVQLKSQRHIKDQAATYSVMAKGTNSCTGTTSRVVEEASCLAAVSALGPGYKYEMSADYSYNPGGCFLQVAYGYIYFNYNTTGHSRSGYAPICMGQGSLSLAQEAPTPSPTPAPTPLPPGDTYTPTAAPTVAPTPSPTPAPTPLPPGDT